MMAQRPPAGLVALSAFFTFGAVMSALTAYLLGFPGSRLDAIWKVNPVAREELLKLGSWAIVLMATICLACAFAAVGLWRRTRWGHRLACGILVVNLVGDLANAIIRHDVRTLIGLPIGGAMIAYLLSRRVRDTFTKSTGDML
jgi:hypothetical protein